jgi:HKD family nuclease
MRYGHTAGSWDLNSLCLKVTLDSHEITKSNVITNIEYYVDRSMKTNNGIVNSQHDSQQLNTDFVSYLLLRTSDLCLSLAWIHWHL